MQDSKSGYVPHIRFRVQQPRSRGFAMRSDHYRLSGSKSCVAGKSQYATYYSSDDKQLTVLYQVGCSAFWLVVDQQNHYTQCNLKVSNDPDISSGAPSVGNCYAMVRGELSSSDPK